jgi:hypothetical protein
MLITSNAVTQAHTQEQARAKRCYELAWRAVLDEPRLRLVHGWLLSSIGQSYYGHAWVLLPGDRVYDAVKDKYFSAHDYAVQHHAIVGRVFTRKQAAKAALKHKHYGPWWTDDEIQTQAAAGFYQR